MKKKFKLKKILNLYNIAILMCILIIGISCFIIFKPEKNVTSNGIEIVSSGVKDGENISEEKAKKIAVKQFKKLKEKTNEKELNIIKIQRDNKEYYYISSPENTLEIKINGGEITRINSVPVKE